GRVAVTVRVYQTQDSLLECGGGWLVWLLDSESKKYSALMAPTEALMSVLCWEGIFPFHLTLLVEY
ncbi:hypothetical protein, partial [Methylicorpusculum sp.]|uniref:hypothetical protein n=1 Tax=Methylicorpusculum sp. TaxID=2713644 RepID=UPI002ABA289D